MAHCGEGPIDYRPGRPTARDELLARIAEIEAFEKTPAGAALKKYRESVTALVLVDEDAAPAAWDRSRNLVRRAELELRTAIERLQSNTLRKRPIAWMRYQAASTPVQFQYRSDAGDPPEDEGWIALYRRGSI